LKRNSLLGEVAGQSQSSIEDFSERLRVAKNAQITEDFMVIARIESLILGAGMEDALARARAYVVAGADGLMIHSKKSTPDEVFEFCRRVQEFASGIPLVVVPTTYSSVTEAELIGAGVSVVIYANHLLRAAYPAMRKVADTILETERAFETEQFLATIPEILEIVPGNE
jgi:phosphoenolpyruvate phosphomutase